ncbi:MAG: XRE family transcriptional regulator [Bacillota bacterium]
MIGRKIKELRLAAGIKSLRQLSIKSGVTIATLSRIESGKHRQPSADTLRKLAPHLNIEQEHLLELAGLVIKETATASYTPDVFIPMLSSITPEQELSKQLDISDVYPVAMPFNDDKHFAYVVKDNSMRSYPIGTVVIARYSTEFTDGAVVIIVRNGHVQIKKAYRDGDKLTLLSGSNARPEIVLATDVFVAGTVVLKIVKV